MTTDLISLAVLGGLLVLVAAARGSRSTLGVLLFGALSAGALAWIVLYVGGLALVVVGVVGATTVAVAGVRLTRSAATITRWGNRTRRTAGVATTLNIVRVASSAAMRRKAAAVRPSLADLTRRERSRVKTSEVAVLLARSGLLRIWASVEDVVTVYGGPRVGKTGWLIGRVIDAPGAVLTTSTRTDLMDATADLRRTGGRPVLVFNPGGLGGVPSTIGFNPLTGCKDPVVATERAADMIPETEGGGDRSYWDGQARRVLAALMHAAALGERSMRDVLGWVADPTDAAREVGALLRKSPEPALSKDVEQFFKTNDRTQSSITSTVMPALAWLTSPAATAATAAAPFDVADLIHSKGTVYLLGRHETHTAPLLAALTGYIAREARRLAAHQPAGRLDPPLTLALDECARVAPIPLPDWSGDAGGSGITIVAAFQSRADLVDRWGPTGAAKILNNSGAVLLFGGTKDAADLDVWSKLAGERDERVVTRGKDRKVTSRGVRQAPVLPPARIANLPQGWVVVFRRGMPPAVGRVQMAWKRRDVRASRRETSRVVAPSPVSRVPAAGA